jgi:hypothetical protein
MARIYQICIFLFIIIALACSSGKKAYERGDYYDAVIKSVQRLRQKPDHSKSQDALRDAYPLAVEMLELNANNAIASNEPFKYKNAIQSYNQINNMYEQIKQCPACMKVIKTPKNYYSELGPLKEKAADESYTAGINALMKGTRNDAKQAYANFLDAQAFVAGYKDVIEYLDKSKFEATLKVLVEQIPVPKRYSLSGDFFQDKVEEYVHRNYPESGFIKFYTAAEMKGLAYGPDQVMKIQFDDFSIGNTNLKEKEENLSKDSVKIGDTKIEGRTVAVYGTVKAKLTTYRKEVGSNGQLSMVITDAKSTGVLAHRKFDGSYSWVNTWARFNGDERALSKDQLALCKLKELQPPGEQDMFLEFSKPIYDKLIPSIRAFYQNY